MTLLEFAGRRHTSSWIRALSLHKQASHVNVRDNNASPVTNSRVRLVLGHDPPHLNALVELRGLKPRLVRSHSFGEHDGFLRHGTDKPADVHTVVCRSNDAAAPTCIPGILRLTPPLGSS